MSVSSAPETKTLEARCFCGSIHIALDVPVEQLPLSAYLCYCSLCRYSTGAPAVFHFSPQKGVLPRFIAPSSEKALTTYKVGKECTYDFCATCGCHIAAVGLDRGDWTPSTSIFADQRPEVFRFTHQFFTKSAPGSAMPSMLSHVGEHEMKIWNPPDDDPRAKVFVPVAEVGPDGQERLLGQCHCGGISFTFGRPSQKVLEDPFMSKYVSPRDKTKWLATYDICDDCRLVDGTHVIGWTFVPLVLFNPPIKPDLKIGSAKTFASSEGVLRSFCGICGATVFYLSKRRQPSEGQSVVAIATGILRCPDGTMGENWFAWSSRLVFDNSGIRFNSDFGGTLRDGMKSWAMEKYGQALEMPI